MRRTRLRYQNRGVISLLEVVVDKLLVRQHEQGFLPGQSSETACLWCPNRCRRCIARRLPGISELRNTRWQIGRLLWVSGAGRLPSQDPAPQPPNQLDGVLELEVLLARFMVLDWVLWFRYPLLPSSQRRYPQETLDSLRIPSTRRPCAAMRTTPASDALMAAVGPPDCPTRIVRIACSDVVFMGAFGFSRVNVSSIPAAEGRAH